MGIQPKKAMQPTRNTARLMASVGPCDWRSWGRRPKGSIRIKSYLPGTPVAERASVPGALKVAKAVAFRGRAPERGSRAQAEPGHEEQQ